MNSEIGNMMMLAIYFWQNMKETCTDICYLSPATINDFTGLLFCAPHADMEKQAG